MTNTELADLLEEAARRLRQTPSPKPSRSKIDLLTEPELAKRLSISKRHLLSLRVQRLIPYVKLGKSVRYNPEAVERAIEKLTIPEIGATRNGVR